MRTTPVADRNVWTGPDLHGALGWTAEQLLRGEHRVGHARRPDGAPITATATAR